MAARAKKKAPAPAAAPPKLTVVQRSPDAFRCEACGIRAVIARPPGSNGYSGNCEWCHVGILVPLVPVMAEPEQQGIEERIVGALPSVIGDPESAFTVSELAEAIEDGASRERAGIDARTKLVTVQSVIDRLEWWAEHIHRLSVGSIQSFERELDAALDEDLCIRLKPEVLTALDRWCFFRDRGDYASPAETRALEFLEEVEACAERDLTSLDGAHALLKILGLTGDTATRVLNQETRLRAEVLRRADGPITATERELESARVLRDRAEARVAELEAQLTFYGIDPA